MIEYDKTKWEIQSPQNDLELYRAIRSLLSRSEKIINDELKVFYFDVDEAKSPANLLSRLGKRTCYTVTTKRFKTVHEVISFFQEHADPFKDVIGLYMTYWDEGYMGEDDIVVRYAIVRIVE